MSRPDELRQSKVKAAAAAAVAGATCAAAVESAHSNSDFSGEHLVAVARPHLAGCGGSSPAVGVREALFAVPESKLAGPEIQSKSADE